MEVHERLPVGWSLAALRHAATVAPRRARWTVVRVVVGLAMLALVMAPGGLLWFVIGLALIASAISFLVAAGEWSIEAPALVCDSRPKWGGQRFVAWRLELDGLDDPAVEGVLAEMCRVLDEVAGPSDEVGDDRTTRAAWGLGAPPSIDAGTPRAGRSDGGPTESGIWLRVDRPDDSGIPLVMWLVSEGKADELLRGAAASIDRPS